MDSPMQRMKNETAKEQNFEEEIQLVPELLPGLLFLLLMLRVINITVMRITMSTKATTRGPVTHHIHILPHQLSLQSTNIGEPITKPNPSKITNRDSTIEHTVFMQVPTFLKMFPSFLVLVIGSGTSPTASLSSTVTVALLLQQHTSFTITVSAMIDPKVNLIVALQTIPQGSCAKPRTRNPAKSPTNTATIGTPGYFLTVGTTFGSALRSGTETVQDSNSNSCECFVIGTPLCSSNIGASSNGIEEKEGGRGRLSKGDATIDLVLTLELLLSSSLLLVLPVVVFELDCLIWEADFIAASRSIPDRVGQTVVMGSCRNQQSSWECRSANCSVDGIGGSVRTHTHTKISRMDLTISCDVSVQT
mmetsp:Transcript_27456/g.75059  ORF Transcript_27456/g.75059 Transcript_27456/m.75059 type:complete len:362 (-) Transcript_27456:451-1536(-)